MSVPLTLPGPHTPEFSDTEDFEGCEFVDGEWRPKHPDNPPDYYPYRDNHEFVNGEWVELNMSVRSDYIGGTLYASLRDYTRRTKAGRAQNSKCGYQCFRDDPRRIRLPDASFIAASRVTDEVRNAGSCRIAPDFAAEVVSPNDEAGTVNRKTHEYFSAGVRLVWIIFPETKSVWVMRAGGTGCWLIESGELSGDEVMPGYSISLDTLFAEE